MRMIDPEIRKFVRPWLGSNHLGENDPVLLEEIGIERGWVIADMVVVGDGLYGYEIKSNYDSLDRLPKQVRMYDSVFDKSTLVVGSKLIDAAMKIVSPWWGITHVSPNGTLKWVRYPQWNCMVDARVMLKLLWREDVVRFLMNHDFPKKYKKMNLGKLSSEVLACFSVGEIADEVNRVFRLRYSGNAPYEVMVDKTWVKLAEIPGKYPD